MITAQWTADQIEALIPEAIKARDFEAVAGLIKLLAVRDPDRAQAVLDTLELGMTLADIGFRGGGAHPGGDT